ncbi:MAG: AsmA family protein [Mariprofundaceae bacterium]
MVKRSVKYSLGLLALLMIVLVITPFFIDLNSYKSQITEAVEDATGRALQIGAIDASLFPWVGMRLDDVRLANRSGFSDHDFLKVESLDVQVALLPLLSKKIEIKQFELNAPELFLERNAAGEGNWEDLLASDVAPIDAVLTDGTSADASLPTVEKKVESAQPSPVLAALNAEYLQLNHGRFVWLDNVTQRRIEVSDLKVEINDVQIDRPIEVKASARIGADEISLDAQVGPLGDLSKLNIEKLPLQINLQSDSLSLKHFAAWLPELPEFFGNVEDAHLRLNLQLEQRPDGIRLSVGDVSVLAAVTAEAKWKVEMPDLTRVKLQELGLSLNEQHLLNAQGEARLGGKYRYQLRIKGAPVNRTWLAMLLPELNTMYAGHPAPWQTLKLGALIAGDRERLELRDVQLMLDKEILQISGVASFDKIPDIRLRLTSRELHLDPWLPEPKPKLEVAEPVPASVESELAAVIEPIKSQEPDLRFLKGLRINSQIQIEKLHLRGLKMGRLRAALKGNRGLFRLDPLRFDLAGGQVTEKATLNVAAYPAKWSESVHMSGVRIGPILKVLADMDMLEGVLQMDTDMKSVGLLPESSLKNLNGRGNLLLRDGSVKGFDIAGTLRNLMSSGLAGGLKKTDFSQLSGSFIIQSGMVKNDDLFMASPLFRLTGHGLVNLPQSSLDYHVKPRLVGTLTGQGDTVTVRKGLSVPLRIRGPFSSPRITPEIDPATLIENVDTIIRGRGGAVLQGLKQVIPGIGKMPQKADPSEQQQPQETTPDQQIQKILERLIPGF